MRWVGWLVKTGLTVVLISGLTVLTTGMVVNAYLKSLLDSFNIQLENEPAIGLNVFGGGLFGNQQPDNSTSESAVTGGSGETGSEPAGQKPPAEPSSEEVPDDALPVMGSGEDETTSQEEAGVGGTDTTATGGEELVMTPGEITEKKDKLPEEEKQQIFNMLMNKLPAEDMQQISVAMEDGLTETELQEIEQVIAKRMTTEEYTKLMELLKE
ncbi:hypothetical protein OIN60_06565 [Paenibacillus sp. P96]|uniref:Magnesium transporter MgtE intracellular domain-containing protein n=1 Tax=Paenibacillus zeirhizosphaerae TaxID=2987519 RepID=A0ABT9FP14_9BACL|nr:hypothetical protein [Paenibacillus sp. P96]MDP4096429.1 hypothetical protein [Paenibacillus sp. P96]